MNDEKIIKNCFALRITDRVKQYTVKNSAGDTIDVYQQRSGIVEQFNIPEKDFKMLMEKNNFIIINERDL